MDKQQCLDLLGLNESATEADIKKAYKTIALKTHPDKLGDLDEDERKEKELQFKEVSEAYKRLLDNNFSDVFDDIFGGDGMESMFGGDGIASMFGGDGMASMFGGVDNIKMFSGMANKLFQSQSFQSIFKTSIKITYYDLIHKRKFEENVNIYGLTVNVSVDCDKFPEQIIEKDINGIKVNIMIIFQLESDNNYNHIIKNNGKVDLIYNIGINHYQYYKGFKYTFSHIDGDDVKIKVDEMNDNNIIKKKRGLNGGNLIIKINLINPKKENISNISKEEYNVLISYLDKLNTKVYKDK